MKPTIAFPPAKPELKLQSHSATLPTPEERRRLEEDIEALRQRETNLREYEAHLRSWQDKLESSHGQPASAQYIAPVVPGRAASGAPFEGDPALHAAWDKVIRARELLEAEQAHLRDDRLNLKEANAVLKRREDALALREARLTQREEEFNTMLEASIAEQAKPSTLARFTQAPFMMAKSVFSSSKPKDE